ncbi:MAG: FMN-binding protein [Phycisphaerae bacterium]
MKDSLHTLLYATILGTVCATLLTGAARFVEPYRKANAEAEERRNILEVLGVPFDPAASSQELVEIFKKEVVEEKLAGLTTYKYPPPAGGAVKAVAVPFDGQGLWGPIKGFLSLEPDMRTIRGITFHEQEETPGLGGEIGSDWWRSKFKGKRIVGPSGEAGIRIRAGAEAINEVDAISGATMTSNKVESMLNEVIEKIVSQRSTNGR